VQEILRTIFGVNVSAGTISRLESQTDVALGDWFDTFLKGIRASEATNTDETGWSKRGERRWLWVEASEQTAAFQIHVNRSFAGLRSLLGEKIHGTVTSDRCKAYNPFSIELRQLCWSNLGRDF
jgi:transposase